MILLYKLVPAHIYISLCVLCWGLVASLQSLTTSFSQLLLLRGLLGITEAAFGPGVPFYMTYFFRRDELAYRVGLQISAAPLATSFASSLAWLIVWITNKIGGIESWRALFLVEGFPSVLVAVWAWYWIPDSPATARWLNPRERRVATLRMQHERDRKTVTHEVLSNTKPATATDNKISLHEILVTLRTPQAVLPALMFFCVNVSFASLPVFLPTIINSMSFSSLTSQALAAPPYLCAFGFVLLIGSLSDRIPDSRGLFIIAVALLSSLSYFIMALAGALESVIGSTASIALRYLFVYPAAMGLFSAVTLIITWTLNNQQSSTSKGAGMVLLNIVGQCGPLVGVHLFPKSQGPHYVVGMAVCAGFMAGVAGLAVGMRWWLSRLNSGWGAGRGGLYEMVGKEEEREQTEGMLGADDGEGPSLKRGESGWRYML
jgi:MFS family permease